MANADFKKSELQTGRDSLQPPLNETMVIAILQQDGFHLNRKLAHKHHREIIPIQAYCDLW